MTAFLAALALSAGYNTAVATLGAAFLGAAAGGIGAFVLLRKRSLVSDAVSHATLPGLVLAFLVPVLLFEGERSAVALMTGAALSAGAGLYLVDWMTRRTRLTEDAAIGAVLSVFFGLGVVLMTVAQTLDTGGQAGLATYLLGSAAGMLRPEAELIAGAALAVAAAVFVLRRPFTLVCFDPEYAAVRGVSPRTADLAMMALVLAVTVIGLRVAGLVLIVALTIIPPVAARFWTERAGRMAFIGAGLGAGAGYTGAALSASAAGLPTGPVIVLTAFALLILSMFASPVRGVLAQVLERRAVHVAVHRRQGLLALSRGEPIYDRATLAVLLRDGAIRRDGTPTLEGRAAAAAARHDEALWDIFRRRFPEEAALHAAQGYEPIGTVLSPDTVALLERALRDSVRDVTGEAVPAGDGGNGDAP